MGSGAVIYVPSFINIGSGIQKFIRGIHRQQRDHISLLYSFKIRKVGYKYYKRTVCRHFRHRNLHFKVTIFTHSIIFLFTSNEIYARMRLNGYNNTLLITSFFFLPNIKRILVKYFPFPTPPVCLVLLHPCSEKGYADDIWSLDTIFFVKHLGV
jgi:hypothetical protein